MSRYCGIHRKYMVLILKEEVIIKSLLDLQVSVTFFMCKRDSHKATSLATRTENFLGSDSHPQNPARREHYQE